MPIVLDPHKGLCIDATPCAAVTAASSGFDRLDWDAHLSAPPAPPTPEPANRKERKAQKKQAVAARRKQKREAEAMDNNKTGKSDTETAGEPINRYAVVQKLEQLCRLIAPRKNTDYVAATFGLIALYKSDVDLVMPEQWLNDNNIAFVYETLWTYFIKPSDFGHHLYLMYPALVQLLVHYPIPEDIGSILPLKDLARLKVVLMPFNFVDEYASIDLEDANVGDHWALALVCVPQKTVYIYDSMAEDAEADADANNAALLAQLVTRIRASMFKPSDTLAVKHMACAQQDNFDDCGVYTIMYSCFLVAQLMSGEPTSLDLGRVRFDALLGRMAMMDLIYRIAPKNIDE